MAQDKKQSSGNVAERGRSNQLNDSPMMVHLMKALKDGQDIGHYGRLTFVMVARHFMDEEKLAKLLVGQPEIETAAEAQGFIAQVQGHDYNPPKRERILEWQQKQDFPICPNPDDPDSCNVYSDLTFPDHVYEHINEYYQEKVSN